MPLMRIQNRLREIRRDCGLSGYDLAILAHLPPQLIYQIERGIRRVQTYEKDMIAEALGVPVEKIFPVELEKNGEILEYRS